MGRFTRWLAALALGCPGCTVFVDLAGFSGGADEADAAPDASTADNPTDAAAITTDADAAAPAVDAGAPLCADAATSFCDDFEATPVSARWDGVRTTGGIIGVAAGAPPSQAALRAAALGVATDQYVFLSKSLPDGLRTLHCELDLLAPKIPAASPGDEVDFLALRRQVDGSPDYLQYMNWYASGTTPGWNVGEFREGSINRATTLKLPTEKWTHLVFDSSDRKLRITVDGVPAASLDELSDVRGRTSLELGITFASQKIQFELAFDNLVCTFGP